MPPGTVVDFAGAVVPAGWLECDGAIVGQLAYAALYAAIGDAYNREGEDELEFRLPNFCGRVAVGVGMDADEHLWPLAEEGGETQVTLHGGDMPVLETMAVMAGSGANPASGTYGGHGDAHKNMPPYLTVLKIIKT